MGVFDDFKFQWNGKPYIVPAASALAAIAAVEEVVTVGEVSLYMSGRKPCSLSKTAMAFGALLRHCGDKATDEEVYAGLFGDGSKSTKQQQEMVLTVLLSLIALMVPPAALKALGNGSTEAENPTKRPRAARSSRKRSKQR